MHLPILIPILVTNAVFIDAERDGEQWLMDWKEEKGSKLLLTNRLKTKKFSALESRFRGVTSFVMLSGS